jgi:hypothetical protein
MICEYIGPFLKPDFFFVDLFSGLERIYECKWGTKKKFLMRFVDGTLEKRTAVCNFSGLGKMKGRAVRNHKILWFLN